MSKIEEMFKAIKEADVETIRKLIVENPAIINEKNKFNNTALHFAVVNIQFNYKKENLQTYQEITKILLENGADATLKNNVGFMPVHFSNVFFPFIDLLINDIIEEYEKETRLNIERFMAWKETVVEKQLNSKGFDDIKENILNSMNIENLNIFINSLKRIGMFEINKIEAKSLIHKVKNEVNKKLFNEYQEKKEYLNFLEKTSNKQNKLLEYDIADINLEKKIEKPKKSTSVQFYKNKRSNQNAR